MRRATSIHAQQRVKERYNDNTSKDMRVDMHSAIAIHNYFAIDDKEHPGRVVVFFSKNKHFLWKVILSKATGDIVTALPVMPSDISLAIEKGIIDPKLRW